MGERDPGPPRHPVDEPLSVEGLPRTPSCPFCRGRETEPFAAFGSQISTSQYYCRPCRTVFEALKWRGRPSNS